MVGVDGGGLLRVVFVFVALTSLAVIVSYSDRRRVIIPGRRGRRAIVVFFP